jgi:nicotinic acid mononucleotide adenylyltransferase
MLLRELLEASKTAVLAFGRMNPPTIGHKKLVDAVAAQAGDPYIFLSQSQKPKTDPLDFPTKLKLAQAFFPNVTVGDTNVRTIIQALQKIESMGYDSIIYVAGSDRIEDFKTLITKYNGTEYNFKNIEVVSAGERDPDADGAEGMSASKMRAAAAEGNFEAFAQGAPDKKFAKTMYDAVRNGMGVKDAVPAEGAVDEGWKDKVAAAGLAGAMALGSAGANARVTPDGQGGFTGGLKPSATVTAPADNKPAAEAPKGFSKEYLQKAADPNRFGRYMISVEKAQELLKNMQEGVAEGNLKELSTDKLAQYKKAAGADAKKADTDGNYARGDKRFKGINKATNKQFDNDLKKHGQKGVAEMRDSRDSYQRDYDSSQTGFSRGHDHRGLGQELAHEKNNIAISINGKTWKVVPGKGTADSQSEKQYLNNMKAWAEKKSAATGKKWSVSLTGAEPTA